MVGEPSDGVPVEQSSQGGIAVGVFEGEVEARIEQHLQRGGGRSLVAQPRSDVRREATACGVTGDDEPTGFRAERARVPQRPACRGVGVDLRRGERVLRGAAVVHRDDRRTTGVREPAAQAVRGEQIPDDEPAAVEVDDQRTVGAASRPVYPDRNPALRPGHHGVVDVADRSPGSGAGDQDSEVVTRLPGGALVQRRPTAALQRAQEQPDAQVGR